MSIKYEKNGMRNAASTLALVGCILLSLLIIPMCWMIPMTKAIRKRIRENREVELALSICYIIFGGLLAVIAGILLIVDYSQHQKPQNKTKKGEN